MTCRSTRKDEICTAAVLDGVYRRGPEGGPVFVEVATPPDKALQAVACTYRIANG